MTRCAGDACLVFFPMVVLFGDYLAGLRENFALCFEFLIRGDGDVDSLIEIVRRLLNPGVGRRVGAAYALMLGVEFFRTAPYVVLHRRYHRVVGPVPRVAYRRGAFRACGAFALRARPH